MPSALTRRPCRDSSGGTFSSHDLCPSSWPAPLGQPFTPDHVGHSVPSSWVSRWQQGQPRRCHVSVRGTYCGPAFGDTGILSAFCLDLVFPCPQDLAFAFPAPVCEGRLTRCTGGAALRARISAWTSVPAPSPLAGSATCSADLPAPSPTRAADHLTYSVSSHKVLARTVVGIEIPEF